MRICVYGAASSEIDNSYIEEGEKLGRELVKRGHSLVFGGGRNGMMGAVVRGVSSQGGKSIGISPRFFGENNAEVYYEYCTEFIKTETMRERKTMLEEMSDAFIISPGGVGTFDEFFEILTLKQLGRHNKAIVILNINNFFDGIASSLYKMVVDHFITKDCVDLCKVVASASEALDYIENYDPTEIDVSKVKIR